MAKQTLRVVTEHGTISRTTDRPYAYVVVARGRRHDRIRAGNEAAVKSARKDRRYHLEIIAELERGHRRYTHLEMSIDKEQASLAALDAFLAGGWEQDLRDKLAQSDSDMLLPFAEKGANWSSRLDLARKTFDDLKATYRDVRIFDVATCREVLASVDSHAAAEAAR